MKPEEMLYAETHEWAAVADQDGKKVATVGITAFAVEQLTDLVYMELPQVGADVTAGEEFGEVESVKAVSPLYSPVTGKVIEIHEGLPDQLEVLSEDPYEKGWIMRVEVTDDASLEKLMDFPAYQKQCAEEQ